MSLVVNLDKQSKIAEILSKLIEERGITANEFSRETGLPHNTIYMILNGKVNAPNGVTLLKFADYFGVSTDFLLGREITQSYSSTTDGEGYVNTIPLIQWQEIEMFQKTKGMSHDGQGARSVEYYRRKTRKVFALPVDQSYLEAEFVKNSIIIIDALEPIEDGDFALIEDCKKVKAIWKAMKFSKKIHISPLGIKADAIELNNYFKFLGKVVESRKYFNIIEADAFSCIEQRNKYFLES